MAAAFLRGLGAQATGGVNPFRQLLDAGHDAALLVEGRDGDFEGFYVRKA